MLFSKQDGHSEYIYIYSHIPALRRQCCVCPNKCMSTCIVQIMCQFCQNIWWHAQLFNFLYMFTNTEGRHVFMCLLSYSAYGRSLRVHTSQLKLCLCTTNRCRQSVTCVVKFMATFGLEYQHVEKQQFWNTKRTI